jgi:hypothetical protein
LVFGGAAICVVSRGRASESTVGLGGLEGREAEPCTNASRRGSCPGKVYTSPWGLEFGLRAVFYPLDVDFQRAFFVLAALELVSQEVDGLFVALEDAVVGLEVLVAHLG